MSVQPGRDQADGQAGMSLSNGAREARLGLVVYGGVSLAIYINGVADELFRAHRGRGVYKLLKRLLDTDIVVDIISGTSAGGINGLLLAYALTNEREFSSCASLWREQGSLAKLLRLIDDDVNTTSLLNTKNYYLPHLERAFRTMDEIDPETRQKERPSSCEELDLFVTGTSFDGELSTAVDATGRRIDIKTHRAVFHLKHRAGRKMPLRFPRQASQRTADDEARVAALARLSAITSCFPAAFEPVKVAPNPTNPHEQRVYEWLKEWGSLKGETWFIDGGVLDNKPFSYTVKEIFNRTALKPVDRKLLYVEPDPERFAATKPARTEPPNVVQAAVQALLGIPGYESIADDLEQVAQRNDRIARLVKARQAAQRALDALKSATPATARDVPPSVAAVYRHTRLSQLADRALRGLMEGNEFRHQLSEEQAPKSRAERMQEEKRHKDAESLAKAFAEWEGDGDDTLGRYDVLLRRRQIFHVISDISERVSKLCDESWNASSVAAAKSYQDVWWKLNEQVNAYDIVLWALGQKLDARSLPHDLASTPGAATDVWRLLKRDFDCMLSVDPEMAAACDDEVFIDAHRHLLHERLKARIDVDVPLPDTAPGAERPLNLLERLEAQTTKIVEAAAATHPELAEAWADFPWHDAHFFPIDYFGDLGEKDAIDVIRVSPIDAERAFSNRRFEDKITGETVMHFGAFLKKSWRSNDIMWGRLDGACRLLDALLTPEALGRAVANPEVRALLAADLKGELAPAVLFPNAGPKIQANLAAWLKELTSSDEAARNRAVQDEESRELLLWCAQLEILQEDLPKVLEDAATEQLEWNNVRGKRGALGTALRLDRSIGLIDSRKNVADFLKGLQKDPSEFSVIRNAPIAKYFIKDYAVGGESLQSDIPPAVLAETITAASLVARNCLVSAFPKQGERLRANLAFKALVDWPLMVAHTLAVFARRERTFYLAGLTMLYTYALLALVGGVVVLEVDLRSTQQDISQAKVIFLVVLPLLILVIGGYMTWIRALRHSGRSWPAALAKGALYFATLALAAPIVVAFWAAWKQTNQTLRAWFQAAPGNEWARLLLPDRFLAWLADSVSDNQWRLVTFYPLAAMVVLLVVVIPLVRGFLQSRMARHTAVVSVTETARELTANAGKAAGAMCATAYSSMRDRLTPKTP